MKGLMPADIQARTEAMMWRVGTFTYISHTSGATSKKICISQWACLLYLSFCLASHKANADLSFESDNYYAKIWGANYFLLLSLDPPYGWGPNPADVAIVRCSHLVVDDVDEHERQEADEE